MKYYVMMSISGNKIIVCVADNYESSFAEDPANSDYQAYLEWVAEGNTAEVIEEEA